MLYCFVDIPAIDNSTIVNAGIVCECLGTNGSMGLVQEFVFVAF